MKKNLFFSCLGVAMIQSQTKISILPRSCDRGIMVVPQPSKLVTRVRFPPVAPIQQDGKHREFKAPFLAQ